MTAGTAPSAKAAPTLPWRFEQDGRDVSDDLLHFADMIGLAGAAPGRFSGLLLLQLYGGAKSGVLNPAKVIHEIRILEGLERMSDLKPATPFRKPPLRGLWHKHYLEDGIRSMALNLRKALAWDGLPSLKRKVAEAEATGEERCFTAEDIALAAHEASHGAWERLQAASKLTGEWIIYGVHEEKNYYLSLGRHDEDDLILRAQIEAFVHREFPCVAQQLTPAEK